MRKELKKELKKTYKEAIKDGCLNPWFFMGVIQAWAKMRKITAEETARLAYWLMLWATKEEAAFVKRLYGLSLS